MPLSAALPANKSDLHHVAARFLIAAALVAAGVLLTSALSAELLGSSTHFSRLRGAYGLVLVAAVLVARGQRVRRPRLASAIVLLATLLAAWGHAIVTGIGLHALVLTGALFAVALSGVLSSVRVAVALAALNAAFIVAVYQAERQGALPGMAAAAGLGPSERLFGQMVFTLTALLVAVLLARVLEASLGRALEQEQRLAELLRIGSDWAWEMDAQAMMTAISPSFEPRTGRSIAEFMQAGRPGGPQPVHDEDWARFVDDIRQRRPYRDRVVTFRCSDGTLLSMRGNGDPVVDAAGRLTGWRGVSSNVTAERAAQKALRRSQAMLDRLVQLSPDPICVAKLANGRILLANAGFVQTAGLPLQRIVGKSALELGLWRDPQVPVRLRDALQRDGLVRDLRTLVHPAGGEPRNMLLTAASFEWDGEPVAVITSRDVTEIERARAQAEAASEAKSNFLAIMSHEIRTPINGVLGLARLLQDTALDETRRREYLAHLMEAAEHLGGIVSDVLDLSKIEAGQLQLEHIGFDLHAEVHSIFRTFAPLGRERGLAMDSRIDDDVPQRVVGDPMRVRQILANYLSNALKFTSRGSIALRLSAVAPGRVRVEVRDSGVGVPEEARQLLFRPFAQADSSTTRRFGGTGLGLAICSELAGRMGGRVGVDSDGVSGSCFWAEIELPAQARPDPSGAADERTTGLSLAGLSVLVAEDNAVNMLIVGTMLRRMGAEVLEAHDGAQAVALVQARGATLHAVLMDLHMPVLDGLQATRRIRSGGSVGTTLPVYALSAAVLEHERLDADSAGMNGFIAKPVNEAELRRVLRRHLPDKSS